MSAHILHGTVILVTIDFGDSVPNHFRRYIAEKGVLCSADFPEARALVRDSTLWFERFLQI